MVRSSGWLGLLLAMWVVTACGEDNEVAQADSGSRPLASEDAATSTATGTRADTGPDAAAPAPATGDVSKLASVPLMGTTAAQARTLCEFRRAEQHRAYATEASVCNQFGGTVGKASVERAAENPSASCVDVINMCKTSKAFATLIAKVDAVDCTKFTLADLNVNDTWRCAATIGDLTACWTESANNLSAYGAKVSCADPATFESAPTSAACRDWADTCYGLNSWDVRISR